MKIIPTVFAKNKEEFDMRFNKLIKVSRELQIDFMDGRFVKGRSVNLTDIKSLRGRGKFEAHLMVKDPENWIYDLKKKGFSKVLFHYESAKSMDKISRIVFLINSLKMKAWIVFNPKTDFNTVVEVMDRATGFEGIMFMGHSPGVEKKGLDVNIARKARNLKRIYHKVKIQVDGGVNDKTIFDLKESGVDIVNVGSFISRAKDPKKAFKFLYK